ncbi:1-acyl-sn-glycerol-3-phosphate acyltransferase delta-like [Uloborus diversus]|uniref:1-acyl-sn-glycerol-3-phosphate acyltransferase delta-like n=1 Tax=Uloborus diversus TaxID=327109 RepID=UPI002409CA3C|nr:1-acyl-sn-glycerol-3-phosphate acyltransferase delta-like [Uloborus diversus]
MEVTRAIGFFVIIFFLTFVFLISGLFINLLQAILYLTLYNRNRSLYRKLNYYLIYTSWAQILSMAEWWSNTSCNLYGDEEALNMFGKEHSIVVMNHKYDTDWLMCWFVCDKLGMLGNAKTCAKKSLRLVPIIGWGWVFGEMIFLERNWEKDKLILGTKLHNLVEYDDPIMLLYFCEGTRFTPEKHKASMEFAKARNLPQLKHHLCPRTNGFNLSVSEMKNKMTAIYSIQLGFPETSLKPTFSNMLRGYSFTGDMHIKRIPMSEVPTESDEATSKWLHQLYQEKDELMDNYFKTNKFPGQPTKLNRSFRSLANSLLWSLLVGVPSLYLLFKLITMGNFWVTVITIAVIFLLFTAMLLMIRVTKADKGSSYGKDKKSPAKSNNGISRHDDSNGNCETSNSEMLQAEGESIRKRNAFPENHESDKL